MKTRWIVVVVSGVIALNVNNSIVCAQLPLGGAAGSAAAQAQAQAQVQAQVQQRIQSQVQQRAQAKIQQQVQGQVGQQVQARLQAEAARAAHIAQQAAAASQRQAAAVRSTAGVSARVGAEATIRNQARVGDQSANADAYARLGITEADVKIYDNIFGRFNPLRAEPAPPPQPGQPAPQQSANSPRDTAPPQDTNRFGDRQGLNGEIGVAFVSRITTAVRERRAEISQLRDRALATSDVQLMRHCEHMEQSMNAFAEAQARAQAEAGAAATTADRRDAAGVPEQRGPKAQGSINGDASGNGAAGVRR